MPGDHPEQGRGAPQVQEGAAQQRQERGPFRGYQVQLCQLAVYNIRF